MGKRSDFARRPQDTYDTPLKAVHPLRHHLPADVRYWEPCAGSGRLIKALPGCVAASDLHPRYWLAMKLCVQSITRQMFEATGAEMFITNPPWTRKILHPLIDLLSSIAPTWLLFDADWMHNKIGVPELLKHCHKIVSVGRVSWMENGTSGKDNCAWYLFDKATPARTEFIARAA